MRAFAECTVTLVDCCAMRLHRPIDIGHRAAQRSVRSWTINRLRVFPKRSVRAEAGTSESEGRRPFSFTVTSKRGIGVGYALSELSLLFFVAARAGGLRAPSTLYSTAEQSLQKLCEEASGAGCSGATNSIANRSLGLYEKMERSLKITYYFEKFLFLSKCTIWNPTARSYCIE